MEADSITILPANYDVRAIAGLTFDAVISESHTAEMEVTENPLETGVSVADHCYLRPLRLTIQAAVSELKLPSASDIYDGTEAGRVRQAWEMLLQLQSDLAAGGIYPFTVVTGLRTYEDMVVTSLTATQDVSTGQMLSFTAELHEVMYVETATATYTKPQPQAGKPARQATPTSNNGTVQPAQPSEAVQEKAPSVLDKAYTYLGGLFGRSAPQRARAEISPRDRVPFASGSEMFPQEHSQYTGNRRRVNYREMTDQEKFYRTHNLRVDRRENRSYGPRRYGHPQPQMNGWQFSGPRSSQLGKRKLPNPAR